MPKRQKEHLSPNLAPRDRVLRCAQVAARPLLVRGKSVAKIADIDEEVGGREPGS